MSLQFVLGPARSGKTGYIYDRMIKESIQEPEREFFFLVPDQSTLNAQRELVTRHQNHGTMNIDVVGFYRLAYRVFEELSYVPKSLLEDEGKSMVIRKVMEKHKKELKVFGSSLKKHGFIDEMKSFFAEMYQYDISREKLKEAAAELEQPGLQAKMDDILLIMESFEEYIGERYQISEQLLDVLSQKMVQSKKLKDAVFYLDGFTGFTPIQRKVIGQLMSIGSRVVISLTMDTNHLYEKHKEYELFAMSKNERKILMEIAEEKSLKIEKDVICTPKEETGALRFLERNLFRYPYQRYEKTPENVHIWRAMNPREESRMVADRIEGLVRSGKYRYKDMVVLGADLESYEGELVRSFEDLEIPYFVDANRKLQNNPCIETILSALKMIQVDFSYEMTFRYLKSGFSCLSMEEADLLENYVIATGVRGFARWNRPFDSKAFSKEEISRMEACRQEFMEEIRPLKEGLKRRGGTVLEKLTCLYEFLEKLDVSGKMEQQQKMFLEQGDLLQAKTYARVYDQVLDLMEQMAEILGEESLSYDDFLSVLESGMEEMTMGVIPPSLDQVVIGDVERTRTEGVKILFFVGVHDDAIPKKSDRGGVINDGQKEILKEHGISLAPTARAVSYMEQFYLYLAVGKPQDELYLSFCKMTTSGKSCQPSYFLDRIRKILPKLTVEEETVEEESFTPKEAMDLFVRLLEKEHPEEEELEWMNALYECLRETAPVRSWIRAKFYRNEELPIGKKLVEELYGDVLHGSVTRLEQFAGCAFSHFMRYGLKLRERLVHQILPMDMGQVFHKTMELVGKRTNWKFENDAVRDSFVDEMVECAVTEVQKDILESSSRNRYLMDRMKRISRRAVWAMETYIKRGDFTPEEYEIAFSEEQHLESMRILLDDGKEMHFSGVVDRMDSLEDEENKYVKIIDYKSGNMKFDFAKVFHGLQMQLVIYMNAMMELMERKSGKRVLPAGMFYFQLDDPIVEERDPDEARLKLLKEMKLSGVANEDFLLIPKMEAAGEEGYLSLPVKETKNGYDKRSSVLNTNQMLSLGRMMEEKMRELGNSLMKGDVSIHPYEYNGTMPCTYCSFRSVCAYEEGTGKVRKIRKISLEEGKHALDERTTKGN